VVPTVIRSSWPCRPRCHPCEPSSDSTRWKRSCLHVAATKCDRCISVRSRKADPICVAIDVHWLFGIDTFGFLDGRPLWYLEDFAEIRKIRGVIVHGLRWIVADLGHGLAVAASHLDDDLQRLVAQIVGEIRANAEG